MESIYFYTATDAYGFLSNFARHGFALDDAYWPTVEHYFQAQKFVEDEYQTAIRRAPTPKEAKRLGQRRDWPLRPDWETARLGVMRRAVRAKFEADPFLRIQLLATGSAALIESSPFDYFWGCGQAGSGANWLGVILMEVRTTIREQEGAQPTLFTPVVACECAKQELLEAWVHAYLTTGYWENNALSQGLRLQERWWVGPREMPLDDLVRCCGPESEMEFRINPANWTAAIGELAAQLNDLAALPPLLVEYRAGELSIRDGNHRYAALRQRGVTSTWVVIWFNSPADRAAFLNASP